MVGAGGVGRVGGGCVSWNFLRMFLLFEVILEFLDHLFRV